MKTNRLVLACCLCLSISAKATVWRVNNQGFGAPFSSIDLAMNNPGFIPGDTIHLEASGIDYPTINITEKVVIIGPGYFLNNNVGLQANLAPATINKVTFSGNSAGSKLIGVSVKNITSSNVDIRVNDITIERCYIAAGIFFGNNNPAALNNIVIRQCYNDQGISTFTNPGPITNLTIFNSYFGGQVFLSAAGVSIQNNCQGVATNNIFDGNVNCWSGQMIFRNNIIKSGTFNQNNNSSTNVDYNLFVAASVPSWLTLSNNVFKPSNVFIAATGSPDFDLTLRNSGQCPECYQGFPSGTQMGIYGGLTPYKLSGIPNIPSIYLLQAPANTIQGGASVPVNISTRSNN